MGISSVHLISLFSPTIIATDYHRLKFAAGPIIKA
jgi:hypothetical protein